MVDFAKMRCPIQDTEDYVAWANTLDSTGEDSTDARIRLENKLFLNYMLSTCQAVIQAADSMDQVKKFVFYGKPVPEDIMFDFSRNEHSWASRLQRDHNTVRLLHAICGMVTESGEMLQALMAALETGAEVDYQNIKEELGDSQWYHALGTRAIGYTSFVPILQGNYRKLVKRYGDKWSKDRALHRDTAAEMDAMDKGLSFDVPPPPIPPRDRDPNTEVR